MSEEMRDATDEAQKYLEMVRTRGEAHANLYRVYEEIASNRELYLQAYAHLYANTGALTPGILARSQSIGTRLSTRFKTRLFPSMQSETD